jgi:hypothetical protein
MDEDMQHGQGHALLMNQQLTIGRFHTLILTNIEINKLASRCKFFCSGRYIDSARLMNMSLLVDNGFTEFKG